MKTYISLSDFSFRFKGYGRYEVTYQSPVTQKEWRAITHDMSLIDVTKNGENPLKKDLMALKRLCKKQ